MSTMALPVPTLPTNVTNVQVEKHNPKKLERKKLKVNSINFQQKQRFSPCNQL
jgi:hypothetical protein